MKINHYYYRSQEEFAEKLVRGTVDDNRVTRTMDWFYKQLDEPVGMDEDMIRFIPGVEAMLRQDRLASPFSGMREEATLTEYAGAAMRFIDQGELDKAQVVLCQAIQQYPDEAELWIMRAMAARLGGNLERAEIFLKNAFRRAGGPATFREMALLRRAQGRKNEARQIELFIRSMQ